MSKFSEGVVLRAAVFLGYSSSEARNAWKLGFEYDHRVLVEDALTLGFDLEFARKCDRNWQVSIRDNVDNGKGQEERFLNVIGEDK